MKIPRRQFIGLSLSTLIAACTGPQRIQSGWQRTTITVSAAASLQDVIKNIGDTYRVHHPIVNLAYNFGSSGSLQRQIEQGAPVDIFISAAPQQMDALEAKALLQAETRRNLLGNQLVLVIPKATHGISDFQDLIREQVSKIALGEPNSVPAGQYGKEVLNSLNLYEQISSKLVFTNNVRQVLAYVETANVDAGLVYATDARISKAVKVVSTAAAATHSPLIYPVAVLEASPHAEAAQAFVQFLWSEVAQALFEEYGFQVAPN